MIAAAVVLCLVLDAATLSVRVAPWRAGAFGREVGGEVAWVTGPAGELRLDVVLAEAGGDPHQRNGVAADAAAVDVLQRRGRGWTLVAVPGGDAVFGPWDREWGRPPSGLVGLAAAVATARAGSRQQVVLGAGTARRAAGDDPRAMAAAGTGPRNVPASAPESFRSSLARRGRGGGGPGERLAVAAAADGSCVQVTSSRRPGTLVVGPVSTQPLWADPAEVFLPWWSLSELAAAVPAAGLESGDETGTPGPDRR